MFLNGPKRRILRAMGEAAMNLDELGKMLNRGDLRVDLFELEREGLIERSPTDKNIYRRTRKIELPVFSKKGEAVVYFVESDFYELIKIGYSTDLETRFDQLQADSPAMLTLLNFVPAGEYDHEWNLHHEFTKYRHHNEWFSASKELILYIVNLEPMETEII